LSISAVDRFQTKCDRVE